MAGATTQGECRRLEGGGGSSPPPDKEIDFSVVVTDFGLAKPRAQASITAPGVVLGTPTYMSPEQVRGEALDGRADVYSLGMVLLEAITGSRPFAGEDYHTILRRVLFEEPPGPRSLRSSIPRVLEAVILKAIEKEPARRYRSARDLAEDLARFEAGETVRARAAGVWTRLLRRAARHRWMAALVSLAVLVALAAGSYALVAMRQARESEAGVRAERLENEARDLAAEGRTPEAIDRYREASRIAPDDGKIWHEMGALELSIGRAEDAARSLARAVELAPEDGDAWFALARARSLAGEWEAAREAADEAIGLAPDDPARYRLRAEARSELGDEAGCLADHQAAALVEGRARERDLAEVDRLLAAAGVREALRRLAILPVPGRERPEFLLRRGLTLLAVSREFDESDRALLASAGVELPRGESPARAALFARAEEDLAAAWERGVDDARLPEALSRLALGRRDIEGALAIWEKVLAARADDLPALRGVSRVLFDARRWDEAIVHLDRLLALAPGDAAARYMRGVTRVLAPLVGGGAASPWGDPGLSITRQLALSFLAERVAIPADERDRLEIALGDLDRAVHEGHEKDSARFYSALALARLDRFEEARSAIDDLLRGAPEDATLLAAKASLLLREGRLDDAEKTARAGTLADEESFAPWLVLANVLSRRGDKAGSLDASAEAQTRIQTAFARDEGFLANLFGADARPRGGSVTRFGLALADLAENYARFSGDDLSVFLEALADEDEGVRRKVEARLWEAGPAAILPLRRVAEAGSPAAERARTLASEIEGAVLAEEEALVRGAIEKYVSAYVAGRLEEADPLLLEMRAARERLAPILVRLALADLPKETQSPILGSIGVALGEEAPAAALPILAGARPKDRPQAFVELGALLLYLTEPPPDSLRALLADEDPEVRALAALYLSPLLGREIEESALEGLRTDASNRAVYARALVAMGSKRAVPDLLAILAERDAEGRAGAAAALGELGDAGALGTLRRIAGDTEESAEVRLRATAALGRLGGEEDVGLLLRLLAAEDADLAGAAAWALGRIGSPEGTQDLRGVVSRPGTGPRLTTSTYFLDPGLAPAVALRAMGVRDQAVLDRLRAGLSGPAHLFGLPVADLLELGDPILADSYLAQARTAPALSRLSILALLVPAAKVDQVPELLALLERAGWSERTALVESLGEVGDPRAEPALRRLLDATPPGLDRVEVAWALSRSASRDVVVPEETRRWTRARTGSLHAAELLARAGDAEALSLLRQILAGEIDYRVDSVVGNPWLQDREPASLRLQAARALALAGDREGLRALVPFLASRDPIDRRYAAKTLEKVAGRLVEYDPLAPRPTLEAGRAAWLRALD